MYVPPGYDDGAERYPVVYVIQGYTGHLSMWANRTPFRQPFVETADAVFAGGAPGCVVVYVDAWTAYGGSQFVDSPGTGRYHSYLCDEIVPWVDAHYRTIPDRESRAIAGKSSGGFGAMITPMLRPDLFGALATHAGDALYELCYVPDFGKAVRALRGYDQDIQAWWADFRSRPAFTDPDDADAAAAARGVGVLLGPPGRRRRSCRSTRRRACCARRSWQRWLDWDPVRMVPARTSAVTSWRAVWIDAGTSDEYYLDVGAEAFRAEVVKAGLPEDRIHFELFEAGHAAIDYRYPLSLAWLAERLAR